MSEQFGVEQFNNKAEILSDYEVHKKTNEQNIENNELYQKIKAEFSQVIITPENYNEQGELLAPNNEPSNLSEEQWKIVRTPSFKEWFGDWEKKYNPEDLNNWAKFQYSRFLESDTLGYIVSIIDNYTKDKLRQLENKCSKEEIKQTDEYITYWNNRRVPITHEISKIKAELGNANFNPNLTDYGKLLDENGEPLVLCRGTNYGPNSNGNFEIPEIGKRDYSDGLGVKVGTFLGKKQEAMEHYKGNLEMGKESFLYSCFVNVKNTKVINEKMTWYSEREKLEKIKDQYDGIIVKQKRNLNLFENQKINMIDLIVFDPNNILIVDVE